MATFTFEQILTVLSPQVQQQIKEKIADRDREITDLQRIIQAQQMFRNPSNTWMIVNIPSDLRRSSDAVWGTLRDEELVILRQAEKSTLFWLNIKDGREIRKVECNYLRCSIVPYDNEVVSVGGASSKESTAVRSDKLLSYDMSMNTWEEKLPCMPTKRSRTTALVTSPIGTGGPLIIVIGGENENGDTLKTVEILDTASKIWRQGQDIPVEGSCMSGAIAHGYLYLLGGWQGINMPTSVVFRCQLTDLLQSQHQVMHNIWEKLPDLPVEEAVCTSFQDSLLVIGGRANKVAVQDIRVYNPNQKRWDVIDYIKKARYICFAVGFPDKLVIFGGRKTSENTEDTMEIFHVK